MIVTCGECGFKFEGRKGISLCRDCCRRVGIKKKNPKKPLDVAFQKLDKLIKK
jgi:hypothetical protein